MVKVIERNKNKILVQQQGHELQMLLSIVFSRVLKSRKDYAQQNLQFMPLLLVNIFVIVHFHNFQL